MAGIEHPCVSLGTVSSASAVVSVLTEYFWARSQCAGSYSRLRHINTLPAVNSYLVDSTEHSRKDGMHSALLLIKILGIFAGIHILAIAAWCFPRLLRLDRHGDPDVARYSMPNPVPRESPEAIAQNQPHFTAPPRIISMPTTNLAAQMACEVPPIPDRTELQREAL